MKPAKTPMKPLLALSIIAAVLAAAPAGTALAQFRWVDANGKVHYGDAPPREAKDIRALGGRTLPQPPRRDESPQQLPFELRRAIERAPVTLYTAPECQPCAPAVALLRERGVPFVERTVVSSEDVFEFRRISGGLRLPYLTVGGQTQSGFSPDAWSSVLDAAGYPKSSILPTNYQWPAAQSVAAPKQAQAAPATQGETTGAPPAPTEQAAAPPPAKR